MKRKAVEDATSQTIRNVREFVNHWFWCEVAVERDGRQSSRTTEGVKKISTISTKAATMPSVKRMFLPV